MKAEDWHGQQIVWQYHPHTVNGGLGEEGRHWMQKVSIKVTSITQVEGDEKLNFKMKVMIKKKRETDDVKEFP